MNLSLAVHFRPFAVGSVYLSDVGFFISVTLLTLLLTVRALARRSGRRMLRFARSDLAIVVFVAAAILFGALGFTGSGGSASNILLFVAWSLTLLTLFALAVRLPLRGRGSRLSAWAANVLIVFCAIVVVITANIALYRHDVHFDATREGLNTPPPQLTVLIDQLQSPLALTYFYNASDPNALAARDMIEIAGRNHPLLTFRAIDLDKEPGLARDSGVHSYNTALLQAGDRKVIVENVTDVARVGYAAQRVLRQRAETICFATGHGETFRPITGHLHLSHVETLRGHDIPGVATFWRPSLIGSIVSYSR